MCHAKLLKLLSSRTVIDNMLGKSIDTAVHLKFVEFLRDHTKYFNRRVKTQESYKNLLGSFKIFLKLIHLSIVVDQRSVCVCVKTALKNVVQNGLVYIIIFFLYSAP